MRLQGEATAQFYERFHTNEDKWNEYLTNYYNETEIHILSKSIRGLIQVKIFAKIYKNDQKYMMRNFRSFQAKIKAELFRINRNRKQKK